MSTGTNLEPAEKAKQLVGKSKFSSVTERELIKPKNQNIQNSPAAKRVGVPHKIEVDIKGQNKNSTFMKGRLSNCTRNEPSSLLQSDEELKTLDLES